MNKKNNRFLKVIFSISIWIIIGILQYYFLIYFTEYVIWDLAKNTNSGYLLGRKISEEELEQDFELERHPGCKYGKGYLLKKYKREGSNFYDQYVRVEKYLQTKKKSSFRIIHTRERDVEVYGIQEGTGLEEARQILYQRGYIKIRNSETEGVERNYFKNGGVFGELFVFGIIVLKRTRWIGRRM